MRKIFNHVLACGLLALCSQVAPAEASGTIQEGNRRYQVREAVCFLNPKTGEVTVLLFDRPLTEDKQAELLAWSGESLMSFDSVGSIRLDFGDSVPRNPSLEDPKLGFINIGNSMLFAKEARPSFKEFAVAPQGCRMVVDHKGKSSQGTVSYQLDIKAPVVVPQPPKPAPADLVKADEAYQAAAAKAKGPEELASFYTSNYLEVLAKRKQKVDPKMAKSLEELRQAMELAEKGAKTSYSIIPKSRSVTLIIVKNLGGGASSSTRRTYVQENGAWKILVTE